jgi:hypothetical protein
MKRVPHVVEPEKNHVIAVAAKAKTDVSDAVVAGALKLAGMVMFGHPANPATSAMVLAMRIVLVAEVLEKPLAILATGASKTVELVAALAGHNTSGITAGVPVPSNQKPV